jgi:NhaA family Na+:H+ antiporter
MEHALSPWSTYLILPLFALANAGIMFESGWSAYLVDPISIGIVVGLVVGKPLGVVLATWLAIRLRVGALGEGMSMTHLIGVGCLAGIGFTMSLFVSNLAFARQEQIDTAKLGIFAGSILAAVLGTFVLKRGKRGDESSRPAAPVD